MRRKWLKRTSKSKQEQETEKQGIEEPATPFSRINKKKKIPESANRKKTAKHPPLSREDRPVGYMSVSRALTPVQCRRSLCGAVLVNVSLLRRGQKISTSIMCPTYGVCVLLLRLSKDENKKRK
jgi:hypothetical protein